MVAAARKFGHGVLNALAIGKQDPAGVVARFQLAAGEGLVIRSAHQHHPYMQFPHDLTWGRIPCPEHGRACHVTDQQLSHMIGHADVIHLNNSERAALRFRIRKPMLLHHHGSLFRGNPERMLGIAKHWRMVQAVSTIDLTKPDPKVLHWLPSPYDLEELADFGNAHRREADGRIRIGHFPTNKATKHTDLFLAAIGELQAEGLPIDLVMSPMGEGAAVGWSWKQTMEVKATCDIVYDQLAYGYGCNSIEAWAMGIPVISGADEWTLGQMARQWPAIPFEEANERTVKSVIKAMVESVDLREDAIERGLNHVRKYHDEHRALERLAELYALAIATYDRQRIPGKGAIARFRSSTKRSLSYDGRPIAFVNGEYATDDPFIATHLRTLAKRPVFGIEEVA
jgi:hypothetical protein